MPRFEDQENMDDEEMELVLNAIEYIKGLNHTKMEYQKNPTTSANFREWANSRAEPPLTVHLALNYQLVCH